MTANTRSFKDLALVAHRSRLLYGLLIAIAFTDPVQAQKIYWREADDINSDGGVFRANTDGTGVEEVLPTVRGIHPVFVLNTLARKVYYISGLDNAESGPDLRLHRADLDFGNAETVIDLERFRDRFRRRILHMAIDPYGHRLFLVGDEDDVDDPDDNPQTRLSQLDLETWEETTLRSPSASRDYGPIAFEPVSGQLYWAEHLPFEARAVLWRSQPEPLAPAQVMERDNPFTGLAVARVSGSIFWTEDFVGMFRSDLDGANPVGIGNTYRYFVVDAVGEHIYQADAAGIHRMDLDGNNLTPWLERDSFIQHMQIDPAGACCLNDGCLSNRIRDACDALEGTFAGENTRCADGACTSGACCKDCDRGGCEVVRPFDCALQHGEFAGPETTCDSCPELPAACCLGEECVSETGSDCLLLGGTFFGDCKACNLLLCLPGACCNGTSCQEVDSPFFCSQGGGTFYVRGQCSDAPCETGACCQPCQFGGCEIMRERDCLLGTFAGIGTDCGSSCLGQDGACCRADRCNELDAQSCADAGGGWMGPCTSCSASICDSGACCVANTCTPRTSEVECVIQLHGEWSGAGTGCAGDACGTLLCTGDLDADHDIDLLDYSKLQNCFDEAPFFECDCADLTGDFSINQVDQGPFSTNMTGPSIP